MQHPMRRSLRLISGVFAFLTLVEQVAHAQTLTWGANGVGGSGNWNTTTADWFNGSQNVTWPSGGNAIFGGASGGSVNASSFLVASSMAFNTPGYVVQNGWIESGSSGLTVTTNVDATISSTLSDSTSAGNFLVKNGPAALLQNGTNFFGTVDVNQGELRVIGSSDLFFSNVALANAPGAIVTLAQSSQFADMGGLSGGGTSGGIVQPDTQARTVTVMIFGGGSFGGVLQNNGSGILAPDFFGGGATQTLTNVNTYSGSTSITSKTLILSGNGSALDSPAISIYFGKLLLDNSNTAIANRIADAAPITMNGATIQLNGNSTVPVEEILGQLNFFGVCNIDVSQSGSAAAQLTFAGIQRVGHATLDVVGPGVKLTGLSNGSMGIVPVYITTGNEWATVGGDGRMTLWTSYSSDINTGSTSDHVKLTATGTTSLAASTTRASLNMQNSISGAAEILDLGGHSLALTTGGILSSGAGTVAIQSGSLSTTGSEIVVTANNNLTITSIITNGSSATTLTKTGPGVLTLGGANTYTGQTAIMQGTLAVTSDVNLGSASTIDLSGGVLQATASFTSTKGFTSDSPSNGGAVDTAGNNVSFTGSNTGSLNKKGLGTLTLTSPATGSTSTSAGILALPNATTGSATINSGGTLQVAGTLSSLAWSPFSGTPILDIGGPAATKLTTGSVSDNSATGSLQVDFGIGAASSDFWAISSGPVFFPTNTGAFQFEFMNLGGVKTGVDYPLMSFSTFSAPSTGVFAFAPDMATAGWAGTFKTTTTSVSVRFSSVPVPEPATLIPLLQVILMALIARRWLFKRIKIREVAAASNGRN